MAASAIANFGFEGGAECGWKTGGEHGPGGRSMKLRRRDFLALAATAAVPSVARTETYPARPVRILVGYAPGGVTDISARLIGPWLSERLGQQFVTENRPGASGNIAAEAVARASPDGYTLLLVAANNAYNMTLYTKLRFDFTRDIVPVASICRDCFVMVVNPSFPAKSVAEFIAYAKANRGKLNMGASGPGSGSQLYAELLKAMAGIDIAAVNYRGIGAALPDLMAGRLEVMFIPVATAVGYVKAGTLRPLGVTAAGRIGVLPDVPAISEFVPGYEAISFTGIGAPANTPAEIVAALNKEVNAALADPTFKTRIADLGMEPFATSPAEFGKFIAAYSEKWGKVIRNAGIKAE
jgi:tripartite-type tricarboxylate transporter receptor subunit TctC